MKSKIRLTALFLSLALFAWMWFSRVPPDAQATASIEAPAVSFLAPDFELESLEDGSVKLSDLKGQPVILNFWASWCPPCRAEMPAFQEATQEFQSSGVVIIAVNAAHQDSLKDVEEFKSQYQLDFPILLDTNGRVSNSYGIHSLPTTYFIDRSGTIQKVLIGGPIPLSLLRVHINQLLQDGNDVPDY